MNIVRRATVVDICLLRLELQCTRSVQLYSMPVDLSDLIYDGRYWKKVRLDAWKQCKRVAMRCRPVDQLNICFGSLWKSDGVKD